jgi:transposase
MIERRDVIKFLLEEGDTAIEIHRRLMEHDRARGMSRSEVYGWVRDIKSRRTDLETISSPGLTWTRDEGPADVIAKRIDENPDVSARTIAHLLSLGIAIATSTVCHYLRHVIGMKCSISDGSWNTHA